MKFKDDFSVNELEELDALDEMTEFGTMNDIEIVCYSKLQELISESRPISDFSKEELMMILAQINSSISFFKDTKYADPENLRKIYKKLKGLFRDELNKRKENDS